MVIFSGSWAWAVGCIDGTASDSTHISMMLIAANFLKGKVNIGLFSILR